MNLPNRLTMARLVMAFLFVGLMSVDHVATYAAAYLVFIAATITDYYDGKIARERGLVTNFGKLLDPVADKVLLVGAFVILMMLPGLSIPAWAVVVIIGREFLITGARSLAATDGIVIAANKWGKRKAFIQMLYVYTFLFLAIVERVFEKWLPGVAGGFAWLLSHTSYWAAVVVVAYTVYSGYQFARVNWSALKLGDAI